MEKKIIVHTKQEYDSLIDKVQTTVHKLKSLIEVDIIDIEYNKQLLTEKDFPRALTFKFQIADETFLSWGEAQVLKQKLTKINELSS